MNNFDFRVSSFRSSRNLSIRPSKRNSLSGNSRLTNLSRGPSFKKSASSCSESERVKPELSSKPDRSQDAVPDDETSWEWTWEEEDEEAVDEIKAEDPALSSVAAIGG